MNATKWDELRNAMMNEMPFQPPYSVKFLTDEFADEAGGHPMDWHYAYSIDGVGFDCSYAIEWLKIRPRYTKAKGALIPPEVISGEEELRSLLEKYNIPYEEQDGVYYVYGYKG